MDSVKKIINNGVFIAALAPLIKGIEASDLATAARVFANILAGLGIKPSLEGFEGCEQAQLLITWIKTGNADAAKMREWTATIWATIDDFAHGKIPKVE